MRFHTYSDFPKRVNEFLVKVFYTEERHDNISSLHLYRWLGTAGDYHSDVSAADAINERFWSEVFAVTWAGQVACSHWLALCPLPTRACHTLRRPATLFAEPRKRRKSLDSFNPRAHSFSRWCDISGYRKHCHDAAWRRRIKLLSYLARARPRGSCRIGPVRFVTEVVQKSL